MYHESHGCQWLPVILVNGFEGQNQCDTVWPTFIPKICSRPHKVIEPNGWFCRIQHTIYVPQEKASNQTPHREFSVECDWQPQVTSQEIEPKMITMTNHFHFLLDFRCLHNSQQKNHQSPSSGSWHGVSTKKIHSVPVFQAPRHGVIALSLCRLQWPVREGQRSPTGERSQFNELRGFGCMGSSSA